MIITLFLMLAADPSGLTTALQTADRLEVWDAHRRKSVTVQNADLPRLAKRIKCAGDPRPYDVKPGVAIGAAFFYELRLLDKEGKTIGKFTLINNALQYQSKLVELADREFQNAIREYFEGPRPKVTFVPSIVYQLKTDTRIIALDVAPAGSLVFGIDMETNWLHVLSTGIPASQLTRRKQAVHDKLRAPHSIAANERFVYLAGSNGIAGFRRVTPGGVQFEPSEFIHDKSIALHALERKLYAAREADIWIYEIAGIYGRLHFLDATLVHPLLKHPAAMASANGHLYVTTAGGELFTFKDDKFVAVETQLDVPDDARGNEPPDKGRPCLTVDGEKLYTVGVGRGLAVWDIARGKPTLIKRANSDGEQAKMLQSVRHVAYAGGRVWLSGYDGDQLAWFEWQDDELHLASTKGIGEIKSLVVSAPGPRGVQYLFAACKDDIKVLTTEPPYNPLPTPEPP